MYILNFILKDSPVWARKAGKDKGKHGNSSLLPEIHADVGGEEKQYPLTIKCTCHGNSYTYTITKMNKNIGICLTVSLVETALIILPLISSQSLKLMFRSLI